MNDTKKKIESENRELLEKVRKEIKAEEKLADEKRKQALEEYRLGLRNMNVVSAEDWNSLEPKYKEELGRYEKTVELLEEKWQTTLDDLGIGQEYEAVLENALMELEEAKKEAESGIIDAREEIAHAVIEARKSAG